MMQRRAFINVYGSAAPKSRGTGPRHPPRANTGWQCSAGGDRSCFLPSNCARLAAKGRNSLPQNLRHSRHENVRPELRVVSFRER